jgi:hypothetical protein
VPDAWCRQCTCNERHALTKALLCDEDTCIMATYLHDLLGHERAVDEHSSTHRASDCRITNLGQRCMRP